MLLVVLVVYLFIYFDGIECIRDGVAFNGGETDFKWDWRIVDLVLIVGRTVNGNPTSVSALVLDLVYLRPVVEEKKRGPVLSRAILKKIK